MRVSLIEYGVMNFPKGMEEFRLYRIEYGGHAESCLCEGTIWLPKWMDSEIVERLLSDIYDQDQDGNSE